ncbi:MAG: hypothetical protein SGJ09_08375 [Phycisphaerae bacterium]|nr:hypothetical protein [Phycisphaerae bacterium]
MALPVGSPATVAVQATFVTVSTHAQLELQVPVSFFEPKVARVTGPGTSFKK